MTHGGKTKEKSENPMLKENADDKENQPDVGEKADVGEKEKDKEQSKVDKKVQEVGLNLRSYHYCIFITNSIMW